MEISGNRRPGRSIAPAIAAMVTNGSSERLYSSANGSPAGAGVRRLTGMWVCSGNQIESNPRSSAARPSWTGSFAWSVGYIVMP